MQKSGVLHSVKEGWVIIFIFTSLNNKNKKFQKNKL